MPIEFILLRKRFIANITLKRFIPSMNSLMVFKVRTFNKCSVTKGTFIRSDTCYTSIMITLPLFASKNFVANIALVFFWCSWYY